MGFIGVACRWKTRYILNYPIWDSRFLFSIDIHTRRFGGWQLGFPNRVLRTRFHPQRMGHFAPLSFPAYGGKIQATRCKIQATRCAGGR
jgi:hypothetical protein